MQLPAMSEEIYYLNIPKRASPPVREHPMPVILGRPYSIKYPESEPREDSVHGIVGGYSINSDAGKWLAYTSGINNAFIWDTTEMSIHNSLHILHDDHSAPVPLTNCQLVTNRFMLSENSLQGPEIVSEKDQHTLRMTSRFAFEFSTDHHAAQIGVITLVQANRFITLQSGSIVTLLDTGNDEPVLYLVGEDDNAPIKMIADKQAAGCSQTHLYTHEVKQVIPESMETEQLASLTVLEHYTSYFMQRDITEKYNAAIWIPAYPSISWGWSIRVEKQHDGEWGIFRRKVMFPITSHNGLELPVWDCNSVDCTL